MECKKKKKTIPKQSRFSQFNMFDLLSSHGCLVQARACMSFSCSEAMVAFWYRDQAKSHSSSPPSLIALQYTTDFRLGLILGQMIKYDQGLFKSTQRGNSMMDSRELRWRKNLVAPCGTLNSLVVFWVVHQLFEPACRQLQTVFQSIAAG